MRKENFARATTVALTLPIRIVPRLALAKTSIAAALVAEPRAAVEVASLVARGANNESTMARLQV